MMWEGGLGIRFGDLTLIFASRQKLVQHATGLG